MQNLELRNDIGTQESRGRRMVRRAGLAAVRQPKAPAQYVALAVVTGTFGVLWGIRLQDALVGILIVAFYVSLWLSVALLYYERRHFYEIILEQEQRIAELEQSLRQTSAGDA